MSPNYPTTPTILVVDDEPSVRASITLILGKLNYRIQTAGCGEEALALAQARSFDLVLTDMKMPGMDGLELAKRLKALVPTQAVILVTAFAPPQARAHFAAVIDKPFSVTLLREQVAAVLAGVLQRDGRASPSASS